MDYPVVRIAHRGASKQFPENTLLAFRKAIEQGVDYLEMDLHLTQDREIVIMHDETLDRTTNGTGFIWDKTLEELRKLDAGRGEPAVHPSAWRGRAAESAVAERSARFPRPLRSLHLRSGL